MDNFDNNSVNDIINEAITEIDVNNNFVKASEMLSKVIKEFSGKYKSDNETLYMSFNNPLEHFIYVDEFKPDKAVHDIDINLSNVYYLYARCLASMNKIEQAEKSFKVALNYNPVNVKALISFSDFYANIGDYDSCLEKVQTALKYAYLPKDLSECYIYYGLLYADIERFHEAIALVYYAEAVMKTHLFSGALIYIENEMGTKPVRPELDKIKAVLEEEEIPLYPSQSVMNTVYALGRYSFDNKNYQLSHYCLNIVSYYYRNDTAVKEILDKVNAILKK